MSNKIYVWDRLVRGFHWSLALTFFISYLTGDDWETIHVYTGYLILILIFIRFIWGFIGSKYARFSNFVRPLPDALTYIRGLASGDSQRYTGHNPAGGLMVIALMLCLLITGVTGLKAYGVEGFGPLATVSSEKTIMDTELLIAPESRAEINNQYDSHERDEHEEDDDEHDEDEGHDAEELWEELHEFFANLTILLVILHVLGVFASATAHKENLLKAMIDGYKKKEQNNEP